MNIDITILAELLLPVISIVLGAAILVAIVISGLTEYLRTRSRLRWHERRRALYEERSGQ